MKKYLFIESHIDDLALCCGGTIAKVSDHGHDITILCLSQVDSTGNIKSEWCDAIKVFNPSKSIIKNFKEREFIKHRSDILQLLYELSKENYTHVFTHSPNDLHQDHRVVGEESIRAFKNTNLITYVADWNSRKITKNYFVRLNKKHLIKKWTALKCYKSQNDKSYMTHEATEAILRVNGLISGKSVYAEAFEVINLIQ